MAALKTCCRCGVGKPVTDFNRNIQKADGRLPHCKACDSAHRKQPEIRDRQREVARRANATWWAKHRTLGYQRTAAWKAANRDSVAADAARRRAKRLQATPLWANTFFIAEAYALAKLRGQATGFPWHVDHIVPLRSPLVCGLHVEHNLQVIPAVINQAKGNRTWPNQP